MKRYAVLGYDLDVRAGWLDIEIQEEWEERVKESHRIAQQQIREGLVAEYGSFRAEEKLGNFRDLGPMAVSIIAYHNKFFRQARAAYVVAAYYPALTAACALGERILNHLLIGLRDDFRSTPEYKQVYRKQSFHDWFLAIDTLAAWRVLLPDVVVNFKRLGTIRNRAIHLDPRDPVTEENDRTVALEAILLLDRIIAAQFGILGSQPWFIPGTRGASYIKKEWENDPFVRLVYLPNCWLVGPRYTVEPVPGSVIVHDDYPYEDREVTDDEFRDLLAQAGR